MNLKKIKSIISLFLLLLLVWGNYNILHFSHFHVDASGQIWLHAHPVHEDRNQSPVPVKHTHSKDEFSILAFIYHVLGVFIYIFSVLFVTHKFKPVDKTALLPQLNPINQILHHISRRGPPAVR